MSDISILKSTLPDTIIKGNLTVEGNYETIFPVGSFYTQYPDADSNDLAVAFPDAYRPAELFGGTWVAQWDDEGIDFHTERTSDTGLQTRTDGKQADQMQQITGNFMVHGDAAATVSGAFTRTKDVINDTWGSGTGDTDRIYFDSANSPNARTGTVTCDANRLVRIYKRTA